MRPFEWIDSAASIHLFGAGDEEALSHSMKTNSISWILIENVNSRELTAYDTLTQYSIQHHQTKQYLVWTYLINIFNLLFAVMG